MKTISAARAAIMVTLLSLSVSGCGNSGASEEQKQKSYEALTVKMSPKTLRHLGLNPDDYPQTPEARRDRAIMLSRLHDIEIPDDLDRAMRIAESKAGRADGIPPAKKDDGMVIFAGPRKDPSVMADKKFREGVGSVY